MNRVAIVVTSQYGQTTKIAERMALAFQSRGGEARVFRMKRARDLDQLSLDSYETIVIGAPVYAGKFSRSLIRWTRDHRDELNAGCCGFFSVSLNAADKRPAARKEDQRLIDEFLSATGLHPDITASLIGALHYREYGFFIRWLLRRISASAGGPTDTSRDHDLTDWAAVDHFVADVARLQTPARSDTDFPFDSLTQATLDGASPRSI